MKKQCIFCEDKIRQPFINDLLKFKNNEIGISDIIDKILQTVKNEKIDYKKLTINPNDCKR